MRALQTVADGSLRRTLTLMMIGTLAGLFSGLFGVGGGSVIVPLLVLLLAYDERAATATSLAAIIFIAAFGAATQGLYGNVKLARRPAGRPAGDRRSADRHLAATARRDALDLAAVRGGARRERDRAGGAVIGADRDRRDRVARACSPGCSAWAAASCSCRAS